MLVLTRKLMEKLVIGDDICITVVRIEGGQVRLGIEAPREVADRPRGARPRPARRQGQAPRTGAGGGPVRRRGHGSTSLGSWNR